MADLSVHYLNLDLRSPIIAGSCGLTVRAEDLKKIENSGAGAVVLKSLFEEQIRIDSDHQISKMRTDSMMPVGDLEIFDYLDYQVKDKYLGEYLHQLEQAKKTLLIPVIASINCTSASGWTSFARQIQDAGADALELNIAILPIYTDLTEQEIIDQHMEIVRKVKKEVSIPVSVKLSPSFANISRTVRQLESTGIKGLVLFNRFYNPDINIDTLQVQPAHQFSTSSEMHHSLRWISLLSKTASGDLCASTGIHKAEDAIKILLAGGKAVQTVSALYLNGVEHIQTLNAGIEQWMEKKGYNYIDQFSGQLNEFEGKNPAVFERIQFMKYYANL